MDRRWSRGRGDGPHCDAMQHGGDFVWIRRSGHDERVERTEAGRRHARGRPTRAIASGPGRSGPRAGAAGTRLSPRARPTRAPAFPGPGRATRSGAAHRGQQADIGTQRNASEHRLIDGELVKQAQHLLRVKVHPKGASMREACRCGHDPGGRAAQPGYPWRPAPGPGDGSGWSRVTNRATTRGPGHPTRGPRRPAGTYRNEVCTWRHRCLRPDCAWVSRSHRYRASLHAA